MCAYDLRRQCMSSEVRPLHSVHHTSMEKPSRSVQTEGRKSHGLCSWCSRISPIDAVGKRFKGTVLARVLREADLRGLPRVYRFGCRPRHSTTLQLTCFLKDSTGTMARQAGGVFLDVAKVWWNYLPLVATAIGRTRQGFHLSQ